MAAEMYGMIPKRRKREPRESATGEHVEQPENAALLLIEQLLEHIRINSRNRYVSTDPVYDERKREEHETLFQVRVLPLLCSLVLRLYATFCP